MIRILNEKEKIEFIKKINQYYDAQFTTEDEVFITQQNKIYLITSKALRLPLEKLRIRNMGLYFGQIVGNEIRLSIAGSILVGKTAKKRVIEVKELKKLKEDIIDVDAFNLPDTPEKGFYIVKYKDFYLGCVKFVNNEFKNYIPKSRRIWDEITD